jgi:hypothetical protein
MNSTQSIQFKSVVPPPVLQPILAPKSFVFLFLNIITVGFYGAAATLSKQHRIKELKIVHKDLKDQAGHLMNRWLELEERLANLLEQMDGSKSAEEMKKLTENIHLLAQQKDLLKEQSIKTNDERVRGLSAIALETITFVGQLLANILSLGFYGVYQNYVLTNRMTILQAQNKLLENQVISQAQEKASHFEKTFHFAIDSLTLREEIQKIRTEVEEIRQTDAGKAYQGLKQAQLDIAALQKKHQELQGELSALKVQKLQTEQSKLEAEKALAIASQQIKELRPKLQALSQESGKIKQESERKDKEIVELKGKLAAADMAAAKVKRLEQELSNKLKETHKNQSEVLQKLAELATPIPPKYIPRKEDGAISGAFDLNLKEENKEVDPQWVVYAKEYQDRYKDKKTAEGIFEAGFQFAWSELLKMAKQGTKIKINDSYDTGSTPGANAVYNYMVLDWLKGGKVTKNAACEDSFILAINSSVSMMPSFPEKVLHYTTNEKGELKPEVTVRYRQHDDFTMVGPKFLKGVDAVSAKWILAQLSEEEKGHLFNLLMASVIEDSHPALIKTRTYMEDKENPRVQLIRTAQELIEDISGGFRDKFPGLLSDLWDKSANGDQEPFIKLQEVRPAPELILDTSLKQPKADKIVDWELDPDVLGDKRRGEAEPRQPEFYQLIKSAHDNYKAVFRNMSKALVVDPQSSNEKIKRLEWDMVMKQYHVTHQMLGLRKDRSGMPFGGQRCLFSNLLAIIVTDNCDLTEENVLKLRKAMARYLDKLQDAKIRWNGIKGKANEADEENRKLKELADLAIAFEHAIKKNYQCELPAYQNWLRNETRGAAPIDIGDLTPLEIQLGAYTLGIKIGLLPVSVKINKEAIDYPVAVNEHGLIVPMNEYYGPNTKEYLLMATNHGSYFGLFPILNLKNPEIQKKDEDYISSMIVESYWDSIPCGKLADMRV